MVPIAHRTIVGVAKILFGHTISREQEASSTLDSNQPKISAHF